MSPEYEAVITPSCRWIRRWWRVDVYQVGDAGKPPRPVRTQWYRSNADAYQGMHRLVTSVVRDRQEAQATTSRYEFDGNGAIVPPTAGIPNPDD